MNKTKIIDGVEFTVAPFMAVEALRLKAYLVRMFGPALGQILSIFKDWFGTGGDLGNVKFDGAVLASAIESLMQNLDEDNYEALIKRLFGKLTAKGKDSKRCKLYAPVRQGEFRCFDAACFFRETFFSLPCNGSCS